MDCIQIFQILQSYLEMSLLLLLGSAAFSALVWTLLRLRIKPNCSHLVRMGYLVISSSLALPIILLAIPRSTLLRPSAQVWSSHDLNGPKTASYLALSPGNTGQVSSVPTSRMILSKSLLLKVIAALSSVAAIFILNFVNKLLTLHSALRTLPIIKQIGKVKLLAADDFPVAFSTWTPKSAIIVIPSQQIVNYSDYKLTIQHEIQHHRHGDTQWLYFIELVKALFFWNPGIYGLSNLLSRLQEFACDDFLIGRRKISPQAYGSCLIRAAESAIRLRAIPAGTTGMAAMNDPSLLKRRIKMILNPPSKRLNLAISGFVVMGLATLMASIAYAAKSTLQDAQLSLEEAKKYEVVSKTNNALPITVNDLVLEKLNHFVGTPEGRKWTQEAFKRMPQYRDMILTKMSAYQVPEELIAIPLFESGFKNLPPIPPQKGAGIWEFISETAKRYKLQISDHPHQIDERMHPEKETEAAMQYLKDLNERFQDWRLAIKAYNEGETQVQTLIDQYHTKDPWVLERKKSSEGYLSGVMAMIIILKNPDLLN